MINASDLEKLYNSKERLSIPFKVKSLNNQNKEEDYYGELKTYIINGNTPWLLGVNTLDEWQGSIMMENRNS